MEQNNTLKIYYVGGSRHESMKRLMLSRVEISTGKELVFVDTIGNDWLEQTVRKLGKGEFPTPPMAYSCTQTDTYDGMPCKSVTISQPEKPKFERLKNFIMKMQIVSCPDAEGNEQNEYLKRYPTHRKFIMMDMGEISFQKAANSKSSTKARSKVLELYDGDDNQRRELYEIAWEIGVVPTGKTIDAVFVELSDYSMQHPEKILTSQSNELAVMDRYCRKAQYMKHDNKVILEKVGIQGQLRYCLEPTQLFATVEGLREFVVTSPERTMQFKRIVDAADNEGYSWSIGKLPASQIENIAAKPSNDLQQTINSAKNNSNNLSLKGLSDRFVDIIKDAIETKEHHLTTKGKTKAIVVQMYKDFDPTQVDIAVDDACARAGILTKKIDYAGINQPQEV